MAEIARATSRPRMITASHTRNAVSSGNYKWRDCRAVMLGDRGRIGLKDEGFRRGGARALFLVGLPWGRRPKRRSTIIMPPSESIGGARKLGFGERIYLEGPP